MAPTKVGKIMVGNHLFHRLKPVAKNLISKTIDMGNRRLVRSVFANEVKQSNLINLKLSSDVFNQYKYKIIATFFKMWIKESIPENLCHFSGVGLTSPTKVGKVMVGSHLFHRLKPVAKNLADCHTSFAVTSACLCEEHVTKQSNLINLKLSSDDFNQYIYKIIATFFKMWVKESHTIPLCHFSGVGLTSPTKVGKDMVGNHLSHRLKPVAKNLSSKIIASFFKMWIKESIPENLCHFSGVGLTSPTKVGKVMLCSHLSHRLKPVAKNLADCHTSFAVTSACLCEEHVTKQSNLINLKISLDVFNQYKYKIIATCFNTWIRESHTAHLCHFSGVGLTSPTKVGKVMWCSHLSRRLKPVAKNLSSKLIATFFKMWVRESHATPLCHFSAVDLSSPTKVGKVVVGNHLSHRLKPVAKNLSSKIIATFFKMWIKESHADPLCHFSGVGLLS